MTRLALAGVAGLLAGVLLTLAIGGGPSTETRTVTRTRTVVANALTTGGTVVVKARVPPLAGQRLDVAKDRLKRAGFDADVDGGGLLGVLKDSNWEVVTQDPGPGVLLEQGSSVHLRVERR